MSGDGRRQYYGRGPEGLQERIERHPRKGGIFKGNPSLTIIFFDLIIIIVIYAIFTFFLSGPNTTETIQGYTFSVSATQVENAAVVTLRVHAEADVGVDGEADAGVDGEVRDPIVVVQFLDGDGRPGSEIKDLLPQRRGQQRVFQQRVEIGEDPGLLGVEIEALSESFTLETPVRKVTD